MPDPKSEIRNPKSNLWTEADLANPHALADKPRRVRSMFAAIAPSYDLNNRVHSLWRDQAWRRAAVAAADVCYGDTVLDVACGTGDLALAFAHPKAKNSPKPRRVLGIDFTVNMLTIAQQKAGTAPATDARHDAAPHDTAPRDGGHEVASAKTSARAAGPCFLAGDALRLPVADDSVDVVSIAFGIRNVADPASALREFHRVLRPGGRVVVLEFSLPRNAVLRGLYNFYFRHVLPRTAALIARDRSGAYRYLPRSVNTFMSREQMVGFLKEAGFSQVTVRPLTLGVAVIYRGVRA